MKNIFTATGQNAMRYLARAFVHTEISTTTVVKFYADIYVSQKMNRTDFGDIMTFFF